MHTVVNVLATIQWILMNACHSKQFCFFWLCRSVVVVGAFDKQEAIFARGGTRAIAVVAEVSGCPLKERKRSPLPEGCGDNVV